MPDTQDGSLPISRAADSLVRSYRAVGFPLRAGGQGRSALTQVHTGRGGKRVQMATGLADAASAAVIEPK
jgi:hypothetical protein